MLSSCILAARSCTDQATKAGNGIDLSGSSSLQWVRGEGCMSRHLMTSGRRQSTKEGSRVPCCFHPFGYGSRTRTCVVDRTMEGRRIEALSRVAYAVKAGECVASSVIRRRLDAHCGPRLRQGIGHRMKRRQGVASRLRHVHARDDALVAELHEGWLGRLIRWWLDVSHEGCRTAKSSKGIAGARLCTPRVALSHLSHERTTWWYSSRIRLRRQPRWSACHACGCCRRP